MFTSCSPGWIKYIEYEYPDLLPHLSSAKSPHMMFGATLKTYWAQRMGIPRDKLVVVSVMPCISKKYECARDEFFTDGNPDVDYRGRSLMGHLHLHHGVLVALHLEQRYQTHGQ